MTVAEQLLALKDIQLAIRTAIEAKGVAVGSAPFSDYPTLISNIGGDTGIMAFWNGQGTTWSGDAVTWGDF